MANTCIICGRTRKHLQKVNLHREEPGRYGYKLVPFGPDFYACYARATCKVAAKKARKEALDNI